MKFLVDTSPASMDRLKMTQEDMAEALREKLPSDCIIVLCGRHGQNISTLIEI